MLRFLGACILALAVAAGLAFAAWHVVLDQGHASHAGDLIRQRLQAGGTTAAGSAPPAAPAAIDPGETLRRGHETTEEGTLLRRFYEKRGFGFAWSDGREVSAQADELIATLADAAEEGLDPDDYLTQRIEDLVQDHEGEGDLADLDLLLTRAFFRYADHLARGRVRPEQARIHWHTEREEPVDLAAALDRGLRENRLSWVIEEFAPPHEQFRRLREALRSESDERKASILRLNMERWRWVPRNLGRRHVMVNIPGFSLVVMEEGRAIMTMKVIAGRSFSPTPAFSDRITYLEFNPTWNIPEGILLKEIVPALRLDRSYLAKNHMKAYRSHADDAEEIDPKEIDWDRLEPGKIPFVLRQLPGPHNPLGHVKFMLPNEHDVYLHDTQAAHLFAEEARDFSHGCIRVEKPILLAEYLLADLPDWSRERIEKVIGSGEQTRVSLPEPVPVHIFYWTAIAEEDGSIRFHEDVYGLDEALEKALLRRQGVSRPTGDPSPR